MGIQDRFPGMFKRTTRIEVSQVVRVRPDWDLNLGGMWLVVLEVTEDYVTGLLETKDEPVQLVRLPRSGVDADVKIIQG